MDAVTNAGNQSILAYSHRLLNVNDPEVRGSLVEEGFSTVAEPVIIHGEEYSPESLLQFPEGYQVLRGSSQLGAGGGFDNSHVVDLEGNTVAIINTQINPYFGAAASVVLPEPTLCEEAGKMLRALASRFGG